MHVLKSKLPPNYNTQVLLGPHLSLHSCYCCWCPNVNRLIRHLQVKPYCLAWVSISNMYLGGGGSGGGGGGSGGGGLGGGGGGLQFKNRFLVE